MGIYWTVFTWTPSMMAGRLEWSNMIQKQSTSLGNEPMELSSENIAGIYLTVLVLS